MLQQNHRDLLWGENERKGLGRGEMKFLASLVCGMSFLFCQKEGLLMSE